MKRIVLIFLTTISCLCAHAQQEMTPVPIPESGGRFAVQSRMSFMNIKDPAAPVLNEKMPEGSFLMYEIIGDMLRLSLVGIEGESQMVIDTYDIVSVNGNRLTVVPMFHPDTSTHEVFDLIKDNYGYYLQRKIEGRDYMELYIGIWHE